MLISGTKLTGTPVNDGLVTNGLQLYLDSKNPRSWPGSGQTWYDLSGKNNHATFYKNPSRVNINQNAVEATPIDGSTIMNNGDLYFDGRSSTAQYYYAAGPNLGTNVLTWTISTWFKVNSFVSASELPAIFTGIYTGYTTPAKGDSVNFSLQFYDGGVTNNNQIYGAFYNPNWQVTTGYSPSLSTWYHGVVTYDGSTINLYVNNSLVGTAANRLSTTLNSGWGYHVARRWDGWDTFDGYVPVVKFYNRALTTAELTQNFNYHRGRYGV